MKGWRNSDYKVGVAEHGLMWDKDGLTIDSEPFQLRSYNDALKKMYEDGLTEELYSVDANWFSGQMGQKILPICQNLIDRFGLPIPAEGVKELKDDAYHVYFEEGIPLRPGMRELAELAYNAGWLNAMVTSAPDDTAEHTLTTNDLIQWFSYYLGSDKITKGKPDPEMYLTAAQELELEPGNCVALEDTPTGCESAKRAGMNVIAVPNEYTAELEFPHADRIITSLEDIDMQVLGEMVREL